MKLSRLCVAAACVALVGCPNNKPEPVDPPVEEPETPGILGRDLPRPTVTIDSPADGTVLTAPGIAPTTTVTGTFSTGTTKVMVKGVQAQLAAGRFTAERVPLREGENILVADATGTEGGHGTHRVIVTVDRTAPQVSITYPAEGATLVGNTVTVIGGAAELVGDTALPVTVTVNGIAARVRNREFVAFDVPLSGGPQVITAVASDAHGNTGQRQINVTARLPVGAVLLRATGDQQEGPVGSALAQPLAVDLVGPAAQPVAGRRVKFEILRGGGTLTAQGSPARVVYATSDAAGRASVNMRLPARAGVAAGVVTATAIGFQGSATFVGGALPGAPERMVLDDGDNQRGAPGELLPRPVGVLALDAIGNAIEGVSITFSVVRGGGAVGGSQTVLTDAAGRARTSWRLGPDEGVNSDQLSATFPGNLGTPVLATATAIFPGVAEETRVTGEVLDMGQTPIAGIRVRLDAPGAVALQSYTTAEDGRFEFTNVPPGVVTVSFDVSGVTNALLPTAMSFDLVAMAGRENRLPRPVYLPRLDPASSLTVNETTGGVLRMEETGAELIIAPGSVTFLDGSKSGTLTFTQVNNERVPMTPPGGISPSLVTTLQPAGTLFDPPARVRFRNIEGLEPGTVVDISVFNHDMNRFVAVGTAQVSEDGNTVVSELGQGMPFAGWALLFPPPPPTTTPKAKPECESGCIAPYFDLCVPRSSDNCPDRVMSAKERVCNEHFWPDQINVCMTKQCEAGQVWFVCPKSSQCGDNAKGEDYAGACNWKPVKYPSGAPISAGIVMCPRVTGDSRVLLHAVAHEMLHTCLSGDVNMQHTQMEPIICGRYPLPVDDQGCGGYPHTEPPTVMQ